MSTAGLCAESAENVHEHLEALQFQSFGTKHPIMAQCQCFRLVRAHVRPEGFAPDREIRVVGFRIEKTADTE